MAIKGRIPAVLAVGAIAAGAAVTAAFGAYRADPGITAQTIKIGGTFPLTGPASLYATIPAAEKAYFDYVNDHGGVNGRKIDFEVLDDSYDPSKTVPLTQQLVEKDNVFAVFGSLGTAPNLAIWGYLNQHKVPQVLIATGDSYWGFSYKKYPWTIGYQPDYPGEAKIYGQYVRANLRNAKIGLLYQNDAYGKNYFAGLRVGLAEAKSKIVSAQPFDLTAGPPTQQMLALKASGATVFFDFATPAPSIQALVAMTKIGWKPDQVFVNNVSSSPTFMKIAAASGAAIDGAVSTYYQVDPSNDDEANLAGVKLAKQITGQYAPKLDPGNSNVVYGLSAAWTMAYALQNAGKTPTRAGLMKALRSLDPKKAKDPFLYPGIGLQTSPTDNFPLEQQILVKWEGGATGNWKPFGKLYNHAR